MRREDFEVRVKPDSDGVHASRSTQEDASIGELFKRLGGDTGTLIQQEAALAKAELREAGARLARDGAKIGVAAGLSLVGVLSLSAFLIIALASLLGGAFWLSSLIVGALTLGAGALMARNAINDIKLRGLRPEQTMKTLRDDAAWAKEQVHELKNDLTSDPTAQPTRR